MGKSQRTKGAGFEREIVRALKEMGYDADRNLDQWRDGGGDIRLDHWMIECKRRAKISVYEWMEQAIKAANDKQVPVVVARGDNKEALAILRFRDFLEIFHVIETYAKTLETLVDGIETPTIN